MFSVALLRTVLTTIEDLARAKGAVIRRRGYCDGGLRGGGRDGGGGGSGGHRHRGGCGAYVAVQGLAC